MSARHRHYKCPQSPRQIPVASQEVNLAVGYLGGGSAHGLICDFVQILGPGPSHFLCLMHSRTIVIVVPQWLTLEIGIFN